MFPSSGGAIRQGEGWQGSARRGFSEETAVIPDKAVRSARCSVSLVSVFAVRVLLKWSASGGASLLANAVVHANAQVLLSSDTLVVPS